MCLLCVFSSPPWEFLGLYTVIYEWPPFRCPGVASFWWALLEPLGDALRNPTIVPTGRGLTGSRTGFFGLSMAPWLPVACASCRGGRGSCSP